MFSLSEVLSEFVSLAESLGPVLGFTVTLNGEYGFFDEGLSNESRAPGLHSIFFKPMLQDWGNN